MSADGAERMPVLFVSHGSPMNAITASPWSAGISSLGRALPRPRAILAISAHWYVDDALVSAAARPATIHDFAGFPAALTAVAYPAPGSPALAGRVAELLHGGIALDPQRGLDHGAWSVLVHLYPQADVPVASMSIDARRSAAEHVACGRALAPLRAEGVLLLASGGLTHNLGHAIGALRGRTAATPDWALRFDAGAAAAAAALDIAAIERLAASADGRMAHPTDDHLAPLYYALGAADAQDAVSCPTVGFELSSLSLRSLRFG